MAADTPGGPPSDHDLPPGMREPAGESAEPRTPPGVPETPQAIVTRRATSTRLAAVREEAVERLEQRREERRRGAPEALPATAAQRASAVVRPAWVRLAPWLVTLPLAVWAGSLLSAGLVSDQHAQYIIRAMYAVGRGKLELVGFAFPPLPLLSLAFWPSPWLAALLGLVGLVILLTMFARRSDDRHDLLPFLLLCSVIATPLGLQFMVGDFNDVLGLVLMLLGWFRFIAWGDRRRTFDGMIAGLCLGLAAFSSRLVIPAVLGLGILLALLFPGEARRAYLARFVILAFPVAGMAAAFAYLSWVFDFELRLLPPSSAAGVPLPALLLHAMGYVAALSLHVEAGGRRLLLYSLPLVGILAVGALGVGLSLPLAATALALVAAAGVPRVQGRVRRGVVAFAAAAQLVFIWWHDAPPTPGADAPEFRRVVAALERAPANRVLMDESHSLDLSRWVSTVAPFVLTRDPGYRIVASAPSRYADYIVVSPGSALMPTPWHTVAPPGFVEAWRRGPHVIYERLGAIPLERLAPRVVQLSAAPPAP